MQLVFFRLHLMLHAYIARFDVIGTIALFRNLRLELNTRLALALYPHLRIGGNHLRLQRQKRRAKMVYHE